MAWYRAGGGGIPSSLKTDMNDVLNKKFGTSQDYPPTDWAPTVNLMGPLPEKTVSGAIVTFADGADAVPLKKCEITLPASLDGYSSVDVIHAGKNLVDGTNFIRGLPSTTIGASIDTIAASTRYAYFETAIKGGVYTVSSVSNDADYYNAILIFGYTNGVLSFYTNASVNASKTVDLSACDYARIAIGSRTVQITVPTDFTDYGTIQFEVGSATIYEPYTAPTTHTDSLGRTIHGGTANVVAGQGESTEKGKWLSELTWTQNASYPHIFNGEGFTDRKKNINWNNTTCLSDRYTGYTSSSIVTESSGIALATGATSTRIYVADDRFETVADFVASLQNDDSFVVLPLETSETFTFDPISIDSKLGNNTLWSEQGSAEVTYRADINLALGGN